jgi:hypothetical protein
MAGLTKIVRDRLGQQTPGSIDHPDANLLAGFVEHSLSAGERNVVLGHLSQCAECRELVSVALSPPEASVAAVAARRGPGWLRRPVLRWAALVASVAIMGTVALMRQPPARRTELASRFPSAPLTTAPLPSDVTISAAPSTAKKEERRSHRKSPSLEKNIAPTELASDLGPAQRMDEALKALPKPEVQTYQAALPSKAPMTARLPVEAFRANSSSTNAAGANQPSSTTMAQESPLPAPPMANRVASAARPVPRALESMHMEAATGLSASIASPMIAEWSISAAGRVQRSRDGRKTWEELVVDKDVVFRAVFAAGPEVWLGGTKGALFHSTDSGQHWTRVSIASSSTTLTDDVTRIEFKDSQHGTLKTARGETWVTSDGGQHWEKQ